MQTLFWHSNPYDLPRTNDLFLKQVISNAVFQFDNCGEYRKLLLARGFSRERLLTVTSPEELPFLPTLYFKHHKLISVPEKRLVIRATSSGTSGNKSIVGFDLKSLWAGLGMVLAVGRKHKLLSPVPCHYIILGYEYNKHASMAVAKTAYGFTWFTPALSRTYALKYENGSYTLQLEHIKKQLIRLSRQKFPVRIIGFPFHAYWLLSRMKEEGIRLKMPKGSVMAFGGGWKQHYSEKANKDTMYRLIDEVLGIKEENCREFFGAVEHPVLYCDCPRHHFHVPVYSRVVIRDVDTFEPVKNGTAGLVNLITPMVRSAPLVSIMTDDLGILHDSEECGCGIRTPYLEILGRVGMQDITTCAAGAENLVKTVLEGGMDI